MATFKAQVEGVTSLTIGTTPTDDELSQFLVDGTREVINRIISVKPNEIPKFGASTNDASDSGVPLTGKILSVVREHDSVSIIRPCSPIDLSDRYLAGDVDSLKYRSKYNPGFYILDGKVHTIPASAGSDNDAIVTQVYYAVNQGHSSSSIDSFPDEYEYLVVLYASFRSIHAVMGAKGTTAIDGFNSLPILSLQAAPTISDLSITAAAPDSLSNATINSPGVATIAKGDISGMIPTYTKPTVVVSTFAAFSGTLGDLNIATIAPVVPTLETLATFNLITVAPDSVADPIIASDGVATLTKPVVTGSQPQYNGGSVVGFAASFAALATKAVTDLSITAVSPVPPDGGIEAFGSVPSYTAPQVGGVTEELTAALSTGNSQTNISDWFDVAGDYIQVEEDSELASSQLDKIAGYITAYSSQVSNNLNEFNAANVTYQADIQKKMKESDLDLSTFSAELTAYQQEVNREVSEWQANKDKDIELWNTQQGHIIQQQQAQMQDALNLFNKENAIFQADIQATLAKAQADAQEYQKEGDLLLQAKVQDYTLTLQKFQADTQAYQTEVASEVQEYTQQLQDVTTANASNLQKYQTELAQYQAEVATEVQEHTQNLQKAVQTWTGEQANVIGIYQADLQNELNKFNKENVAYQANVQAELAKVQIDAQEAQKEGDLSLQADIQEYTLTLQNFQANLTAYQAEVNTEVQEYTQNLAGDIQVWQIERTTDLTEYQLRISEYQADTQAKLGKHTQELQVSNAEYQWLQDQYTRIKSEYDTAFVALAPPQPVPQNKRN